MFLHYNATSSFGIGVTKHLSNMKLTAFLIISLNVIGAFSATGPSVDSVLGDELFNSVVLGDYNSAVAYTKELLNQNKGHVIAATVNRLLLNSKRNIVEYAYQLWNYGGSDAVKLNFPIQFRLIVDGNNVKLINKRDNLAMKLALKTDSANDRLAYGAKDDKTSERVSWKFVPIWEANRMYFMIVNNKHNQNLKLEVGADSSGEHRAWGADKSDTYRHQWYLHPIQRDNDVLFFIFNREFNHALKLGRAVDSDGDRLVWGHSGDVINNPDFFGWFILPL